MGNLLLYFFLLLILALGSGCAVVRVSTDEQGRIAGVLYFAMLRRYDAQYTFAGPLGDHVSVGIGANSEVEKAMALLEAAARLGAKGVLP